MKRDTWIALNDQAKKVEILERNVNALKNVMRPLDEYGIAQAPLEDTAHELYLAKERERRKLSRIVRDADEPLWEWVDGVHGLGDSLFFLLGLMPPLNPHEPTFPGFPCPAAVHKYVGLHTEDGKAVRRKQGEFLGFSAKLRAYATVRLVDPVIKTGCRCGHWAKHHANESGECWECDCGGYEATVFRAVYDERKEHTMDTHPPMLDEGEGCEKCDEAWAKTRKKREGSRQTRERKAPAVDCSNVGGVHWTKGHRHNDAVRKTSKMILADAWAIENGREPRFGYAHTETRAEIPALATV